MRPARADPFNTPTSEPIPTADPSIDPSPSSLLRPDYLVSRKAGNAAAAFEAARPGDIVLLAGKGHERSISGPDGEAPWDERGVAMDMLAAMGYVGDRTEPD